MDNIECPPIEIKEEPLDDDQMGLETHSETLFVREEHYDFHGVLKNLPTAPIIISSSVLKNEILDENPPITAKTVVKEEAPSIQPIPLPPTPTIIIPAPESAENIVKKENRESEDDESDSDDSDTDTDDNIQQDEEDDEESEPDISNKTDNTIGWFEKQKVLIGHACSVCEKTFTRRSDMKRHEKIHIKSTANDKKPKKKKRNSSSESDQSASSKFFTCRQCNRNFTRRDVLRRHLKKKHPDLDETVELLRLNCTVCSKYFKSQVFLDMHYKLHQGKNPYECDYCQKDLKTGSHLIEHLRIHTGEKPFKCDLCDETFIRVIAMKKHKQADHGIQGLIPKKPPNPVKPAKEILCNVCGKSFTRNDSLKMHMRLHTGEKPYMCDICSREFSYRKTLREHHRLHTGEKPFECVICEMKFVRANDLKVHVTLVHYDPDNPPIKKIITVPEEKKYACDTCFGRFKTSSILKVHKRSHTGERPFVCEHCQKPFITAGDLRIHVRIHTGEKPYKCAGCNDSFRVKPLLTKHQKRCKNFMELDQLHLLGV